MSTLIINIFVVKDEFGLSMKQNRKKKSLWQTYCGIMLFMVEVMPVKWVGELNNFIIDSDGLFIRL